MARSRMIKPEFFDDEKLSECSVRARLLFIALWVNSDDYGVVKGNPKWIKAQAFPYDENIKAKDVESDLEELSRLRCIIPFNHNGESFYYIRNWNKYQKVNRPSKENRNPEPPHDRLNEPSVSPHGTLIDQTETETQTETEDSSTRSDDHDEPVIISIPLIHKNGNGKPQYFQVFESYFKELQESYPGVDVFLALKDIRQWNHDNPTRRKTSGGIKRHISQWMSRAQNKGEYKRQDGPGKAEDFDPEEEQRRLNEALS